jgi:CCR4-NOT transcription complex subunit 3
MAGMSQVSNATITPETYAPSRRANGTPSAQQQAASTAPSPLPAQLQHTPPSPSPQYPPGVKVSDTAPAPSSSADPMHVPQQQQIRQASIGTPAPRTVNDRPPSIAPPQYLSTFSDLAASYESVKAKCYIVHHCLNACNLILHSSERKDG